MSKTINTPLEVEVTKASTFQSIVSGETQENVNLATALSKISKWYDEITAKTPDQTYNSSSTRAQSGVAIEGKKATVNGKLYDIDVKDGIEEVSTNAGSGEGTNVKAPMPGAVLRVLKSVGDSVEENEEIFVIEAMKMETPIKSPVSGTINSISVAQGDKVQTGQVMATVG